MGMIKNIVFDVGMVLIDFHWDTSMRELGIPDEAIEHLGRNMFNHKLWKEMDRNVIPEAELIAAFKRMSPGYEDYIDLFLEHKAIAVDDFPQSAEWLKELKDKGYMVYLLSNYPESFFLEHLKRFSFLPYTDGMVVSYECRCMKPEPRIYEILCERYNIKPEESVFLDDRIENVEAAQTLGFQGIHVTDVRKAREELCSLLSQN